MESKPKKELVRIVADKDGNVCFDSTGKAAGRGVYLCHDQGCFQAARKKRAIGRSLDLSIPEERLEQLFQELSKNE